MQDFYLGKVLAIAGTNQKLMPGAFFKTLVHSKMQRVMKLTAFLLLVAFVQVSAKGLSQNVSITVKDAPLIKVFQSITKQTGFRFFYNQEQLHKSRPVSLHLKDVSLEEALALCFKNQPFTYSIVNKVIVVKEKSLVKLSTENQSNVPPPFIDVRGRVVNEKGEPVDGVSVGIKGTSTAVLTDVNGEFSLSSVDKDAILVFSHISMETFELKVSGKTELAISLKTKVSSLGDVQVVANTGYQTVKPNEMTGSLSVIDNKALNQQTGTNILNRLNNVTNGVYFNIGKVNQNPQNKTNISIRGLSTINGPLDPLIVLDNFIYEGDINNINPNDVESITILKDAAATSIWGSRAGNGVIVITTKRGKFNQKLKVGFNSNVILTDKPDVYYLSQISPADEIDVEQWIFNKGYFNSQISNTSNRPALTPAVEIFLKRKNGLISASDSADQINFLKAIDSRDQYKKYFYQDAITQQYALNLSGGSNNVAWLISGAFDKNIGTLKSNFDKVNFRFKNSYKPIKNFLLDAEVYYTTSKAISGITPGVTINNRIVPYLQFADDNGDFLAVSKYRNGYLDTVGSGKLLDWKYYPLDDYKHDVTTSSLQEIVANLGINYQIIPSLRFSGNYQYQRQSLNTERLADLQSFYTRDLINNFAQINTNGTVTYIIPYGAILNESNSVIKSQNIRGQLNYTKSWDVHAISAIGGSEIREVVSSQQDFRYYGYNKDPLTYGLVDYKNSYRTRVPNSLQTIPNPPSIAGTATYRFVSIYSNASYTYRQKYSLYGSVRRDAANVFGVNTNDKWKPLWSTGISWDLSKENFYKINKLSYLKFKVTYGFSGNVDASRTPLPVSSSGLTSPNTGFPAQRIGVPNNPLLRWEKTGQLNFGMDFSLIKQVLSGSVEYYSKKSSDLYGEASYDYTTYGRTNTVTKNVANMKATGLDIVLRSKNLDKQFKWTTTLFYSYNTSKTTAYFSKASQTIYSLLGGGGIITPVVGYPLYAIAAYKWGGLNSSGDPQGFLNKQLSTDYNSISNLSRDSGLSSGSMVYKGPANPTNFGSMINELNWKGFYFSFNISYRFGYYFRRTAFSSDALINGGSTTSDYANRWQVPGDETITNVPALVYTNYPQFSSRDVFYRNSEINVLRADHIRLQYLNLAYCIYNKIGKLAIEQIQVYANVANLGILWRANKENLDPDYPSSMPMPKSYTIGLRASF
jgi:TonB-linked SusC/RagA family outer membrane protein